MRLLSQNILENKDGIFFETKVTIYEMQRNQLGLSCI